ncbi:MAG: DUF808 domain-containing protein [Myxococcales bacterium]|nr:DUF808 domain-containing protein [Myxococcales bacterium]MCB9533868.1 DUF808 domain-containing protein [Myxococcales bacterium]
MAGTSLLALIDDIASILDDVSLMTKVAAKKTAGVLGDDLALNAEQVTGVNADRELPVVFAVARGSLMNKAILVPAALAISALVPAAIGPLLMVGGSYLCFEGTEKIAHKFLHGGAHADGVDAAGVSASAEPPAAHAATAEPATSEAEKIRGAVRTDFVLSAEIITIALGTVEHAPFMKQVAVLVAVAVLMSIGVYGLVAAIVKLDDLGLLMLRRSRTTTGRGVGRAILAGAPLLMKTLSVAGTVAMFLVGGGIVVHGIAPLHHWVEHTAESLLGGHAIGLATAALNGAIGLGLGGVLVALATGVGAARSRLARG